MKTPFDNQRELLVRASELIFRALEVNLDDLEEIKVATEARVLELNPECFESEEDLRTTATYEVLAKWLESQDEFIRLLLAETSSLIVQRIKNKPTPKQYDPYELDPESLCSKCTGLERRSSMLTGIGNYCSNYRSPHAGDCVSRGFLKSHFPCGKCRGFNLKPGCKL